LTIALKAERNVEKKRKEKREKEAREKHPASAAPETPSDPPPPPKSSEVWPIGVEPPAATCIERRSRRDRWQRLTKGMRHMQYAVINKDTGGTISLISIAKSERPGDDKHTRNRKRKEEATKIMQQWADVFAEKNLVIAEIDRD
jgi:hypothetical protein